MNNRWFSKDLLGFSLASFFNDFSHEMTTAILPTFVQTMVGAQEAPYILGLISGISNAAASFMKLIAGWLSDRITQHKLLLMVGYGLTPLFSSLIGTAHHAWQIITYRTIGWIGRGLREPPRDAWMASLGDKQHYGKIFGFQRAFDTLGALGAPLLALLILKYFSLITIFYIALIPGIFSVLSIALLVKPKQLPATYAQAAFFTQFKSLPFSFISFIVIRAVFGISNFDRMLIILRAQEMMTGQSSATMVTTWAIILYAIFNLIRAISEYSIGVLSDDYGKRKNFLALCGFGLFGITCLFLLMATSSIAWWVLIFIVAAVSTATLTTLEKAYAADLLPDTVRGTGFGLLQTVDGFCTLFCNVVVGLLWHVYGASYAFAYAAIFSFISMILLLLKK